jgi:pyrroloquinoline quinone biosynthesis protein B
MRVIVLGSAAGGGFPQWNCNCGNCRRARANDPNAIARTQSSLAVSANGAHWCLLNASPDLRQQLERTPALHPRGGVRDNPIAGVVLTNADVDHVAGLLSLRESQPFVLYATRRVLAVLAGNPVFDVLRRDIVARVPLDLDGETVLTAPDTTPSGLAVEPFAVPGKVALYLESFSAGPGFGTTAEDTIGLKVREQDSGSFFYYMPACARLSEDIAHRLADAPLVFFDGTTWTDDEMLSSGAGVKTAGRMGHMSVSGANGSLAAFASLAVRRKIFIHINNTNPMLLGDSPERRIAEAAGWEISFDGMEVDA